MKMLTKHEKTKKELWTQACRYQKLSEAFIRKHENEVDWVQVSFHQKLSIKFAEEFKDKLAWDAVARNTHISERFIKHFFNREDIIHRYIKGNTPETDKTRMGRNIVLQQMWFDLTKHHKFSEQFLREFQYNINWDWVSKEYKHLSFDFIREMKDKIQFQFIIAHNQFNAKKLNEMKNYVDWGWVSKYQNLNEQFIRRNSDKIDVNEMLNGNHFGRPKKLKFSDKFVDEIKDIFADVDHILLEDMFVNGYQMTIKQLNKFVNKHNGEVNWELISRSQYLDEKFIDKYADKLDWHSLSAWQNLTPYLIEKYKDKIDWDQISMNEHVDEHIFLEYKDKFGPDTTNFIAAYRKISEKVMDQMIFTSDSWERVCCYQKLSEEFMRRHKDELNWEAVTQYQSLSLNFIKEMKDRIKWYTIGAWQKLDEDIIWKMRKKMNLIYVFSQIQHLSESFMEKLINEYE